VLAAPDVLLAPDVLSTPDMLSTPAAGLGDLVADGFVSDIWAAETTETAADDVWDDLQP
jgi:hypothetical protein